MNRHERRATLAEQHAHVRSLPQVLQLIPRNEYPFSLNPPVKAWQSRHYFVQLYDESEQREGLMRLTISRAKLGKDGRWKEGLSWDELQDIKREVGFGDWYAVEIYPRDCDVVNDANMRHLWVMRD